MLYHHHPLFNLINLLHGRDVLLLQRGHLIIIVVILFVVVRHWHILIVVIIIVIVVILKDGESELDELVDAAGELDGFLEREARGQQRRLKQQPDQVLDRLVRWVRRESLFEGADNGMAGINLHGLLAHHVTLHRVIPQGLRLHDPLHIGTPPVLSRHQRAGALHHTVTHNHLLHFVTQNLLHLLAQSLKGSLVIFLFLLLILSQSQIQSLFGDTHQLLPIIFPQLLHCVLINRVHQVQPLQVPFFECLQKRRGFDRGA